MKLYGAFSKVEEQDDGTIIVEGIASTESVDSDGEVVKASAIAAALPDYMRDGTGALREMHQPLAAGTAIASVEGEVTTIKGHVVDPVAVKKVKAGVYKGFSIGGKVTSRDTAEKNTITGLRLVEISLVDRPANPDARLTMWKADDIEDTAEKADDATDPDDQSDPGDENPEAIKTDKTADLAKGLWNIGCLVEILCQLNALQECTEWECEAEGDNSQIPADLKAAVSTLADILVRMTGEEVAEMQAGEEVQETVEMAAAPVDLAKAEDAMLAKVQAMLDDALAKAVGPLNETITKQAEEIAALKAMPAAPRGVIMQVNKAEDIGQVTIEKVEPVRNPDGSVNEAATEIKKLSRAGGVFAG